MLKTTQNATCENTKLAASNLHVSGMSPWADLSQTTKVSRKTRPGYILRPKSVTILGALRRTTTTRRTAAPTQRSAIV
eukprot:2539047-Pleurochrysis_carterae.AAC.2